MRKRYLTWLQETDTLEMYLVVTNEVPDIDQARLGNFATFDY